MPTKAIQREEICPFTLEPYRNCYISKNLNGEEICPFMLEPCYFNVTGGHRGDRNTMTVSKKKRSCIIPAAHVASVKAVDLFKAGWKRLLLLAYDVIATLTSLFPYFSKNSVQIYHLS